MKIIRFFLYSSAFFLFLTASAKIISATGNAKVMFVNDPLTGLQFRSLLLIVGCIEIIIGIVCVLVKQPWIPPISLGWLATNFLIYRIGLWLIGYQRPCSCMGNLTDALHIPPQITDVVMKSILAYLLIGSYAALFWLWRQRKKLAVPEAAG